MRISIASIVVDAGNKVGLAFAKHLLQESLGGSALPREEGNPYAFDFFLQEEAQVS